MEVWLPIPNWPYYEASSFGRIRSIDRVLINKRGQRKAYKGQLLKHWLDQGYPTVSLSNDTEKVYFKVHALICAAFHGERPEGLDCRHLDDNKENNYYENLMWGVHIDNMLDAKRNGIKFGRAKGSTYVPIDPEKLRLGALRRWSNPEQRAAQSKRTKNHWQRVKNLRT